MTDTRHDFVITSRTIAATGRRLYGVWLRRTDDADAVLVGEYDTLEQAKASRLLRWTDANDVDALAVGLPA